MEHELEQLQEQMNAEIKAIREKYSKLKKDVKAKYKVVKPKKTRISIPKTVKDNLWDQHFGKEAGIGKCYCCNAEINSKKFDCGHIISVADGGTNNIDNLKPICSTCNKSMGTQNMETFKKEYFEKNAKFEKCNYCQELVSECDAKAKSMSNRIVSIGISNNIMRNIKCRGNTERTNKNKTNSNIDGHSMCLGCFNTIKNCNSLNKHHKSNRIDRSSMGFSSMGMMGNNVCQQYLMRNNMKY